MPTTSTPATPSRPSGRRSLLLRIAAALALAVSAYVHVDLAQGPWIAAGQVTLAGLFVGDAVAALVVGLWVLVRGSRLAWLVAGVVASVSLLALVVSVYVLVPAIGPLPAVYEPFWYPEKVVAAVAAGVAALAVLVALTASRQALTASGRGRPATVRSP